MKRYIHSECWLETEAERAVRQLREQKDEIQRQAVEAIHEANHKAEAAQLRKEIRKLGHQPCA